MRLQPGIKEQILDLVYPPVCALCRRPCELSPVCPGICRSCLCGLPWRFNPEIDLACLKLPLKDNNLKIYCAAYYRGLLRQALIRFKFADACYLAQALSGLLLLPLQRSGIRPQAVIPVPLHKRRLRERGYNQAALLASKLAESMKVPCLEDCLVRHRETARQSEQVSREERIANLEGAFIYGCRQLAGKPANQAPVILVDDVLTTGATVTAAAAPLLAAGYRVIAAVAASNKPEAQ